MKCIDTRQSDLALGKDRDYFDAVWDTFRLDDIVIQLSRDTQTINQVIKIFYERDYISKLSR